MTAVLSFKEQPGWMCPQAFVAQRCCAPTMIRTFETAR
jgi:hypothetical protein